MSKLFKSNHFSIFGSSILFLIFFSCSINLVESDHNKYNSSNLIETVKETFVNLGSLTSECRKVLKTADDNCGIKFTSQYPKPVEKDYCCYYYANLDCFEAAVKSGCDYSAYKSFKEFPMLEVTNNHIQQDFCPNYKSYDDCKLFPLKTVLLITGSLLFIILVIVALVIYKHYRTGFHRVASNESEVKVKPVEV